MAKNKAMVKVPLKTNTASRAGRRGSRKNTFTIIAAAYEDGYVFFKHAGKVFSLQPPFARTYEATAIDAALAVTEYDFAESAQAFDSRKDLIEFVRGRFSGLEDDRRSIDHQCAAILSKSSEAEVRTFLNAMAGNLSMPERFSVSAMALSRLATAFRDTGVFLTLASECERLATVFREKQLPRRLRVLPHDMRNHTAADAASVLYVSWRTAIAFSGAVS